METTLKNVIGRCIFSLIVLLPFCLAIGSTYSGEQAPQLESLEKVNVFVVGAAVFFSAYLIATIFLFLKSLTKSIVLALFLTPVATTVVCLAFMVIGWGAGYLLKDNPELSVYGLTIVSLLPIIITPIISIVRLIIGRVRARE